MVVPGEPREFTESTEPGADWNASGDFSSNNCPVIWLSFHGKMLEDHINDFFYDSYAHMCPTLGDDLSHL